MFLAHIGEDKLREQSILGIWRTAELTGEFASTFGSEAWGYGCCMMHDIGKYSDSFQKRIHGGKLTDHALQWELYQRHNYVCTYCISGIIPRLLDGGSAADVGGEKPH